MPTGKGLTLYRAFRILLDVLLLKCHYLISALLIGRKQRTHCRSSSWTARRLWSSIRRPNKVIPSPMTSLSAPWIRVILPLPASRQCMRHWLNLCCWGPSKDSTPACLLTAKQGLGSLTREFWFQLITIILFPLNATKCSTLTSACCFYYFFNLSI